MSQIWVLIQNFWRHFDARRRPSASVWKFQIETQKYFWTGATKILGALHFTKYTLFIKKAGHCDMAY